MMYVGSLWVVGRLVSMQPPWSTATSISTLPGFINLRSSGADQSRSLRAGDQHRSDDQIGELDLIQDVVTITVQRVDVRGHHVIEISQAIEIDIQNGNVRLKTGRDPRGIRADNAAAKNRDVSRSDAGDATKQNAATL